MKIFYSFFAVGFATDHFQLVCDFGEDCSSFCDSYFCEYRWELNHRHTMSWRTFTEDVKKMEDYPLVWDENSQSLQAKRDEIFQRITFLAIIC